MISNDPMPDSAAKICFASPSSRHSSSASGIGASAFGGRKRPVFGVDATERQVDAKLQTQSFWCLRRRRAQT